jgi:hypothetical protein
MILKKETTVHELDEWLKEQNLWIETTKPARPHPRWVVTLVGPRGGLRARGFSFTSWYEAISRALINYEAGVVP